MKRSRIVRLGVEKLESRLVLSQWLGLPDQDMENDADVSSDFQATIVAGDPNGSPADSPSNRVDPNTSSSPFGGVGSVRIDANRGTYICTGTAISNRHILTAGHCVDLNSDGKSDKKDGIKAVYFQLNYGGDLSHKLLVSKINMHPDFTGFNKPSVNDDVAVLTLASGHETPSGVPIYPLTTTDLAAGTNLTLVGYGRSGDGINGYYVNASWTVKRTGLNDADAFFGQDDAGKPVANEVWRFDFDGPTGNGTWGGPTLGNDKETQLGGGDSGGPAFAYINSTYVLAGNNTFTQGFGAPKFGTLGGGMNLYPYQSWINSILSGSSSTSDTGGSSGGRSNTSISDSVLADAVGSTLFDVAGAILLPLMPMPQSTTATDQPRAVEPELSLLMANVLPDQGSAPTRIDRETTDELFEESDELPDTLLWDCDLLSAVDPALSSVLKRPLS